jgi:hypothetical protein
MVPSTMVVVGSMAFCLRVAQHRSLAGEVRREKHTCTFTWLALRKLLRPGAQVLCWEGPEEWQNCNDKELQYFGSNNSVLSGLKHTTQLCASHLVTPPFSSEHGRTYVNMHRHPVQDAQIASAYYKRKKRKTTPAAKHSLHQLRKSRYIGPNCCESPPPSSFD